MIQPISSTTSTNFNYSKNMMFKGKIPFMGFYDPACSGGRGPMPLDTFGVIAEFTKKTAEKVKGVFVYKKVEQISPDSPVIAGLNRFKETYMPEIAKMGDSSNKLGIKLLDDRNFINGETDILTHILPDGITTVNLGEGSEIVQSNFSFGDKVRARVQEKFGIDLSRVPDWADPSSRYLTDSEGKILYSSVSHEPYINPWYDPNYAVEKISAASSLPRPTMDDFLAKAAEFSTNNSSSAFIDITAPFERAGISFESIDVDDVADIDDGVIDSLADGVKKLLEFLSDCV